MGRESWTQPGQEASVLDGVYLDSLGTRRPEVCDAMTLKLLASGFGCDQNNKCNNGEAGG